jgi:hypothetical protein
MLAADPIAMVDVVCVPINAVAWQATMGRNALGGPPPARKSNEPSVAQSAGYWVLMSNHHRSRTNLRPREPYMLIQGGPGERKNGILGV